MARERSDFAKRLRELRLGQGLTLQALADRAGMHLQGLAKVERGDREPNWLTVLKLAQALGVSTEAFIDRSPRPGLPPPPEPPPPRRRKK